VERWLPIPGMPMYEVSDQGRVRSWKNGKWGRAKAPRILRANPDNTGYRRVTLSGNSYHHVHVLVLECFVSPRPVGCEAAHEDGVTTNARLDNLSWKPIVENNADRRRHGTLPLGEGHQNARLTEAQVRWARRMLGAGWTQKEVAAHLGVVRQTIGAIARGSTWREVE
jgi:hypothetical protein